MKVLNLYAGIGGNRKLWEDVEVTAVEWDEQRAAVYADLFPDDVVIVGDAHQYLLDHYKEFEFIWSSPPCPTHGSLRSGQVKSGKHVAMYPDMKLWQEIVFLQHHATGKYSVENVKPYYDSFWPATIIDRHYFWSNFTISKFRPPQKPNNFIQSSYQSLESYHGIRQITTNLPKRLWEHSLRNCVHPTLGKHILDCARGQSNQPTLIDYKQEALI